MDSRPSFTDLETSIPRFDKSRLILSTGLAIAAYTMRPSDIRDLAVMLAATANHWESGSNSTANTVAGLIPSGTRSVKRGMLTGFSEGKAARREEVGELTKRIDGYPRFVPIAVCVCVRTTLPTHGNCSRFEHRTSASNTAIFRRRFRSSDHLGL